MTDSALAWAWRWLVAAIALSIADARTAATVTLVASLVAYAVALGSSWADGRPSR